MDYVHACSFCGWRRQSATAVMLSPSCERCGCSLDAVPAAEARRPAGDQVTATPFGMKSVALRVLTALFAVVLLLAAARVGFAEAGLNGGLMAVGAAGFLLLPFVPERI
jgi:hypothetical protein